MMQVFDNLRAILTKHKENMPVVTTAEMLAEIDEAESKWEAEGIPIIHGKAELKLHDKVVRAKAISEMLEIVNRAYHNFGGYDLAFMQKYGNTTAAQQYESYSTMMMYEIANELDNLIDEITEKLKEK